MFGVEHLVFPFLLQRGVGAVGFDFAQGLFQAGLLLGIAVDLGQFDLIDDALLLGGATGQPWRFLVRHQRGGQRDAKAQQGER
ncbi:hypothetical protein D3C78_1716440 [compost metagenome]